MWSSRSFKSLLSLTILLFTLPVDAFSPPKVGQQYLSFGLTLEPGLMTDDAPPDAPGLGSPSLNFGHSLRLGFHHFVSNHVMAGAEANIGYTFFNEHTANSDGLAASEKAFSWQLGVVNRLFLSEDSEGFFGALGLHIFRASLDDAPLLSFGGDIRLGWTFWSGGEFALIELGYAVPLIQGLSFPTDFSGMQESPAEQDWGLHRTSISIVWGF